MTISSLLTMDYRNAKARNEIIVRLNDAMRTIKISEALLLNPAERPKYMRKAKSITVWRNGKQYVVDPSDSSDEKLPIISRKELGNNYKTNIENYNNIVDEYNSSFPNLIYGRNNMPKAIDKYNEPNKSL